MDILRHSNVHTRYTVIVYSCGFRYWNQMERINRTVKYFQWEIIDM